VKHLVIGGAYSVDKFYRLKRGYHWFPDEQASEEIKSYVEQQIAEYPVDVILTHTCPYQYRPTEAFLPGIDNLTVDDSMERWLEVIERKVQYVAWLCGHWHINKRIDKIHFLYDRFESLDMLMQKGET